MGIFGSFMSKKGATGITGIGVASAGIDSFATYHFDQQENPDNSKAVSAAKGIATGAAWLVAEPLMWGITVGQGVAGVGKMMYEDAEYNRNQKLQIQHHVREDATGAQGGTLGGNFVNNEQTATMRQRQMGLLRQHKMSTESIMGSEARQLHR